MNKNNNKVPVAILSCFLIAFIAQGVLKLSGIFIFEKALDWQVFKIIDASGVLQVIYYSIIVFINIYCLSFALTDRPYSNKWYHYLIMLVVAFSITAFRTLATYTYQVDIICDVFVYILIPFVINLTSSKDRKLFDRSVFGIVMTLALNIMMYFCYIGLGYWSNLLTSILLIEPIYLASSTFFLITLEMYIGLVIFMISMNIVIKEIKQMKNLNRPVNIGDDDAKIEELDRINKGK